MLDDAAQAFGATYKNRRVGTLAPATATSFFPAKPLGCYGDGGAVFTDDDDAGAMCSAACACTARAATSTTTCASALNGRLDTIQAAVLIEKLKIFPDEIVARERVARRYSAALADVATVPQARARARPRCGRSTRIRLRARPARCARRRRSRRRASRPRSIIRTRCTARAPTGIFRSPRAALPVSERLADEVISLPMHAYLDEATQDRIIAAVRRALAA